MRNPLWRVINRAIVYVNDTVFQELPCAETAMDNRVSKEATEENIELEWHYTPQNYFEKQISLEREGYSIDINAGRVTVNLTPDVFKSKPGLRDSNGCLLIRWAPRK